MVLLLVSNTCDLVRITSLHVPWCRQNVKIVIKSLINKWKSLYSPDVIKAAQNEAAGLKGPVVSFSGGGASSNTDCINGGVSSISATGTSAAVLQTMADSPGADASASSDSVAPSPDSVRRYPCSSITLIVLNPILKL